MATATTTKEIEMTTRQKAPTTIISLGDLDHRYPPNATESVINGSHGYCTIHNTGGWTPLYDIYCENDGETILIGRDLMTAKAIALINQANTATFNGEEV